MNLLMSYREKGYSNCKERESKEEEKQRWREICLLEGNRLGISNFEESLVSLTFVSHVATYNKYHFRTSLIA